MDIAKLRDEAEAGNVVAEGILGGCYLDGIGVEVNYDEALRLLSKAAERGQFLPTACLARMYEQGLGIPVDLSEALRLYEKAGRLGHFHACIKVAHMYEGGIGTYVDKVEATRWFLTSIAHSDRIDDDKVAEVLDYLLALPGIRETLYDALIKDPDELVRGGAALAVAAIGDDTVAAVLSKAAMDPSEFVRDCATTGLGDLLP